MGKNRKHFLDALVKEHKMSTIAEVGVRDVERVEVKKK